MSEMTTEDRDLFSEIASEDATRPTEEATEGGVAVGEGVAKEGDVEKVEGEHEAPGGGGPPKRIWDLVDQGEWPNDYVPLNRFMEKSYLSYAMSVVLGRALPRTSDGLKPVQLRILWAMHLMRLGSGAKHVKSARVVGDVIGKYHPHGDTSVYDAMVRQAQDFTLRYPLVDGQGNFGSLDGDSAAAMRYTECRLTPIAELLLGELNSGTVDFRQNYDGSFEEPVQLPAQLPFILLNGASGIAVGMATEVPPHNLGEVCDGLQMLLKRPEATLDEVMSVVGGPDFAGGGQLTSSASEIRSAYETGRGVLQVRARWRFEEMARGEWKAVIYEMPPGVSCAKVLSEIEAIINPQIKKGKKELSQEQRNDKSLMLSVLDAVRDESSKSQRVRMVLEPKSRNQSREEFMQVMCAMTSLWTSSSVNMNVVGTDGRPLTKGLMKLITEWIEFRTGVIERRSRYRIEKIKDRLHILDGRAAVLLRIEEVIAVIRQADEPKAALMESFSLSEIQAEDILEIRLRALARLEGIKIERELADLRIELAGLEALVNSDAALRSKLGEEVELARGKFADSRRTLIEHASKSGSTAERAVVDEAVTLFMSRLGWLHVRQGHGLDGKSISYKEGDGPENVFETRTSHSLCVLDSAGRAYAVLVAEVPVGRTGSPLASLAKLDSSAKLVWSACGDGTEKYLFWTDDGYGFVASFGDALGRNKAGKQYMKPGTEGKVMPPVRIAGDKVYSVSSEGRLVVFALAEVKELPAGGKGVMLQKVGDGVRAAAVAVGTCQEVNLVMTDGRKLKVSKEDFGKCVLTRASKGCFVARKGNITAIEMRTS